MGGRTWTPAEDAVLRSRYADDLTADIAAQIGRPVKSVLYRAHKLGLHKSIETISRIARQRNIERNERGLANAGHFQPGHATWNKGMDYKAGGRSVSTQFRPGHKPWTWVPIGSLRIVDGQLQRKANDDPGPNHTRWKPVSRLVWEEVHGPVPADHLVVFKPGRATCDPELLTLDAVELITRAEHARRNSVHRLPPELRQIHRLRAVLTRTINARSKSDPTETQPTQEPTP